MSSFIPPILSSSPPPLDTVDDDDDDFGDFAAAQYSSKEDGLVSKLNLDESSWNGAGLNSPPTQPSTPIKENGISTNHRKSDLSAPGEWEVNEDEETQQHTDNTSQNSVVSAGSAVTDSGLCSASQNSEGVSPLPQSDLSEEETRPQLNSSPVVECNNSESIDSNSPVSVLNIPVTDILGTSDERESTKSAELNSGCVSRRSSSPPDLELSVKNVDTSEQEECSPTENEECIPNPDSWSAANDDDFGDFSGFNQSPLNFDDEVSHMDFVSNEPVQENFQLKEELKPLEFEEVQVEEKLEAIQANEKDYVATPHLESDIIPPQLEGDITPPPLNSEITPPPLKDGDTDNFDEFSSFENPYIPSHSKESNFDNAETVLEVNEGPAESIVPSVANLDCSDDFTDFESAHTKLGMEKDMSTSFADFSSVANTCPEENEGSHWANPAQLRPPSALSETDSFGDFESDNFQSSIFTCEDVRKRLPEVLLSMFPPLQEEGVSSLCDEPNRTYDIQLNTQDSKTWQSLRDLESTPALSFHWPGSHANKCLLAALNIDSRNVLFGPKWSTVVPRFASNLSFGPLEPVRAGQMQTQEESQSKQPEPTVTPQPSAQMTTTSLELQDVVPAAQFDWSGSGLENPLECKSKAETPVTPSVSPPSPSPLPPPLQPAVTQVTPATSQPSRNSTLSPEAVRVLDSLPELAFLSAKKLMFPVYGEAAAQKH